ncbi:MAG: 23S rRNA (adenine(2503)-C(2))-methyltransferase RlmN [FCB group bacterium]|nr:23S rRNA (adenine(2503)-C(2))-methyltransferase RlmN [FCB group bacterium]
MSTTEIQAWPTIVGFTEKELRDICAELEQPSFRAGQLFHWIYNRRVRSFAAMENLPKTFRELLEQRFLLRTLSPIRVSESETGATRKYLFSTPHGDRLETVLIQDGHRLTLCVSSQIGCALDCTFCATASMGFRRNLLAGEIVEQFFQVQDQSSKPITNIVFMGMGEPFLNYSRVMKAAALFNAAAGINVGARRITISTAGIVPQIQRFTREAQRYKLAISLNASTDEQRTDIMPITNTHPLKEVMSAARDYGARSRHRVTFEYVLLKGINDNPRDARRLKRLLSGVQCKLNVIPYNEIGGEFSRPSKERIDAFLVELVDSPFTVTVRWSGGEKIRAGCGQLAVEEVS